MFNLLDALDMMTLRIVPLTLKRDNLEYRKMDFINYLNLFVILGFTIIVVLDFYFYTGWEFVIHVVPHALVGLVNFLALRSNRLKRCNWKYSWIMYSGVLVDLDVDSNSISPNKLFEMYKWLEANVRMGNWAQYSQHARQHNLNLKTMNYLVDLNSHGQFPLEFIFRRTEDAMLFKLIWSGNMSG